MSTGHSGHLRSLSYGGVLVSLGIIFGDIGTSPLYVLKAIIASTSSINNDFVLGALSCIIWTLTLQTTIKYVIITLQADNRGEGGIFSLFALLRRKKKWLYVFAIIGGSTLLADGVITPSITVTSAIEGLSILHPNIPTVGISMAIIFFLFFIQQFGTSFIGKAFGPIMFVWFTMLGVLGLSSLIHAPIILKAFNPYYAINLITSHPSALFLLGAVFLCTTGAEALYTDLGHCGIQNIRASWAYVKIMLILNYLGQGAWIINHGTEALSGSNPFYSIMPIWFVSIGVIIATLAAVIASQALITGSFTLISEAISLNFWPKLKMKYPSQAKGQMYIPVVNRFLFFACIGVILLFQTSSNMEAAYGLSITITMLMTTLLMLYYLSMRRVKTIYIIVFGLIFLTVESSFFIANIIKFFHGGWFTVVIATILGLIMTIMFKGRVVRNRFITYSKIAEYLPILNDLSQDQTIPKYAENLVYTTHADNKTDVESKLIHSILNRQPKRADHYWFLHVDRIDTPYTLDYKITKLADKVTRVDFYLGFKVQPRIYEYFKQVLQHLNNTNQWDAISTHPSLRKHNINSDFRFVQIDRRITRHIDLPFWDRICLTGYFAIRKLGLSDVNAYELDLSLVTIEQIPLSIPSNAIIPQINKR